MSATDYVASLQAEVVKLRAFKAYVHQRLDAAGVPTDPDSPHRAEGCRVGGRLDLALAGYGASEQKRFVDMLVRAGVGHGLRTDWAPPGEAVLVETGGEVDFIVAEFAFDDAGKLKEVTCYEGEAG